MECMQGQAIKNLHTTHAVKRAFFCALISIAVLIFNAAPLHAMDDDTAAQIDAFYAEWVAVQQSNIPALKQWVDTHLDKNSEISVEITAKVPALIDYKFHKTLEINAEKVEDHLIQWLNIHKHSVLTHDIKHIEQRDDTVETEVHYSANGVTVLPNGRHQTIRLKTELEIVCLDILTKQPPINVMKSNCALMATSIPLRALK